MCRHIVRRVIAGAAANTDGEPARLGIDQPAGWWPVVSRLKAYEAAGFAYAQVRMPPRAVLIEPALPHAILFHVHDNYGARVDTERAGQVEPLRLDLHLPPGAGCVPWEAVAPLLARHRAPLQLEIHPAGRPEPGTLAVLAREVLGLGEGGVVAAR